MAGGKDSTHTWVASTFMYYVSTNSWNTIEDLPGTRWNFIPREGSLLAFSGLAGGNSYTYDITGSSGWTQLPILDGMGRDMGDHFGGVLIEDDSPFDCTD